MNTGWRVWRLVSLFLVLALGTCGGGGDDFDPATADLNGWWAWSYRAAGSDDPWRTPLIAEGEDTGDSFTVGFTVLERSGAELVFFDPSESALDRTDVRLTVRSVDRIEGLLCGYNDGWCGACQELVYERIATPAGQLVMLGTIDSQPVAVDCSVAHGSVGYYETWQEYDILDHRVRALRQLSLNFSEPGIPPPGIYDVVADGVAVQVDEGDLEDISSSGTVTLTVSTAEHIAGTFDVLLSRGGSTEGSFDVQLLLTTTPTLP